MEDSLKVKSTTGRTIASMIFNKIMKDKLKGANIDFDVVNIDLDHVEDGFYGSIQLAVHVTDDEVKRLIKEAILK